MLRAYLSPQADLLAQALIPILQATQPAHPLDMQNVAVGNPDSGRWLKHFLAQQLPICAGIDTPLLSRALWSLGNQATQSPDTPDPLGESELTWGLFDYLQQDLDWSASPELSAAWQTRRAICQDDESAHWLLAQELAGLFDRYLVYRPDWILNWQQGEHQHWQGALWHGLWQALGQPEHRAARWQHALLALKDFRTDTPLIVFNPGPVPQPLLQQVAAFAQHNDVLWFQFSPSEEFLGELESPRQASSAGRLADLPFIGSMVGGLKAQLEFLTEHAEVQVLSREISTDSALGQLQHSIITLDAVSELTPDDSLQIARAPGAVREVEELKEWLAPRLQSKDLNPRDVLVLTPDVERFGPLVKAVFEDADTGYVPVAVLDRIEGDADPSMAAMIGLIEVVSDASRETTLDWFGLAPVRERYGFSDEDLAQFRHWAETGGWVRGLTESQPIPGPARHHLQALLDRLMYSWVFAQAPAGYAIEKPLLASQADTLDRLCAAFQDLLALAEACHHPATRLDWWARLHPIACDWVTPDSALSGWLSEWSELAYDRPVSWRILRSHLQSYAKQSAQNVRFAAGRMNLCTPLPARGLPFKIIALLGFESGAFPRPVQRSDLDLMHTHPRPGDRHANLEDRALFLESLLNAQQALYLSYAGVDPVEGNHVPPCVPLGMLLQHLGLAEPDPAPINLASHALRTRPRLVDSRRQAHATPHPWSWQAQGELPDSPEALRMALVEPFQAQIQALFDTDITLEDERSELTPLGISEDQAGLWVHGQLDAAQPNRWLDSPYAAQGAGGVDSAQRIDARVDTLRAWRHITPRLVPIEIHWCGYTHQVVPAHQGKAVTLASGDRPSARATTQGLLRHLWLCGQGQGVTSWIIGAHESLVFAPLTAEQAQGHFQAWIDQWQIHQTERPIASLGWVSLTNTGAKGSTLVASNIKAPLKYADRFEASAKPDTATLNEWISRLTPLPKRQLTPDPERFYGTP